MEDLPSFEETQPAQGAPQESLPSFDETHPAQQQDQYGGIGQTVMAGIEGLRKGILGPVAALEEKYLPATDTAESQKEEAGRAAAHPVAGMLGEIGGLLSGAGESGVISNIGAKIVPEAAETAHLASKIGRSALRGAIEAGMFQGGDEIGKAILGEGDPEAPVSAAIVHMGAAGLVGALSGGVFGGVSSKLKDLANAETGTKAANAVQDFGNRWKYNLENPNLNEAIPQELSDFYNSTKSAVDEVRGSSGLKSQAIDALSKSVKPESVSAHVDEVSRALRNSSSDLQLNGMFNDAVSAWKEKTTPQIDPITLKPSFVPNASDAFKATENLKRQLQEFASPLYEGRDISVADKPFVMSSANLATKLKNTLEDPSTWGSLGELQKTVNKATANFLPALKDFNKRFTKRVLGESTLDPGPINTYVNQLGKPNAEIKQSVMKNFVDAAEKYRDEINNIHASLGVDAPIHPASLNAVKGTYGATTPGGDMADYLHRVGVAGSLGNERIPKYIADMIGKPVDWVAKKYVIPAAVRMLSSDASHKIMEGLDYANNVSSGAQKINSSVENLFKVGGQQVINAVASERDREKLKAFIKNGGVNKQLQDAAQENYSTATPPPVFAHGGEVEKQEPKESNPDVLKGTQGLSSGLPTHNMMLQTARGRVSNYLHSVTPQPPTGKLPFDKEIPNEKAHREYDKIIDLANQPLGILNNIKDGTLTPDKVGHFKQMYPELHGHLSKKIMEKVLNAHMDEERPPKKVRQALGLFLGSPLDSTMTAQNMLSIQATFMKNKMAAQSQGQQQKQPKQETSKLGKLSSGLMTQDQARSQKLEKT